MAGAILPARFVPDPREAGKGISAANQNGGRLLAWCPWCETEHQHGDAGRGAANRIERRGAACNPHAFSPLARRGYALSVRSNNRPPPVTPMTRLGEQLWRRAERFAQTLRFCMLFMLAEPILGGPDQDLEPNVLEWSIARIGEFEGEWSFLTAEGKLAAGSDLLTLAARLYNVTEGVAGVRMIEAATGARLDCETALVIAKALEGWAMAGRPGRAST